MLDRQYVEKTHVKSSNWQGKISVSASLLAELCRVYLAWHDAPEVDVEPDMDTGGETGAIWLEQEMIGKRVRLVEVKE